MDWDDVRHFLALARSGSVRAAGSQLGVSHSTVARRVAGLEDRLGAKLFDRHRDGYLLTTAGHEMVASAERVEREMEALERGLAGQDARLAGPIRVTCTDPYMGKLILAALLPLCEEQHGIELELDVDAKNLDLSKREADIAVRALSVNASPPEHLIGRRIAPICVASYVGTAHAARLDPEKGGRDARWLGSDLRRAVEDVVAASSYPELPVWGSFDTMEIMIEAARAGLGLIALPTYACDPDPALSRLAKPDVRHLGDFWLLSHGDLRENARLRRARELITAATHERAALFRGDEGRCESAPLGSKRAPSAGETGH